jgi:hypothetical protein
MSEEIRDPNKAVDFIPIPGWPEYEISRAGEIRRVKPGMGAQTGKALKWQKLENGYAKVSLCRDSKRKEFLVHRLVALAFIGEAGEDDVCHFDGDKWNNHVDNLRIDSRKGNMADQIRMGKTPRGEKSGSNKYTAEQMRTLRARLHAGESVTALSTETGIPKSTLYGLRAGQTWGWL